jgi:hypothetical protein
MSTLGIRLAILGRVVVLCAGVAGPGNSASLEYQVKAAFLYNFAKFVEWPAAATPPGAPLVVCVFGADPFGPVLEETIRGRAAKGRPIEVRRIEGASHLGGCAMVFVGAAEPVRTTAVLDDSVRKAVLTVGESAEFQERGGMIRFVLEDSKVRFDVNLGAARKAGLRIRSQLLGLARTVDGRPTGGAE